MIRGTILSFAAAGFVLAAAHPAGAQDDNRFALGINYTRRLVDDERARAHSGFGIKWRLGQSKEGWGRHIGLGWFAADVDRVVDGRSVEVGELKIRPFVAGYGYTHDVSPKLHITGDVVGGLSFNSLEIKNAPPGFDADISRVIPILRPEMTVWYDVHRKIAISVGAGYTIARPKLTITSGDTRTSARLRADAFSISTGIVYRLF